MDIRQYLRVPLRRWKEISLLVLVCVLSVLFFSMRSTAVFPVTMFYTISLDDKQLTEEFKYSNFYATQSGLEFTRTVSGWFDDPLFEAQVFAGAKLDREQEIDFLSKLVGFFKMKRVERQNIQVTFKTNQDDKSNLLADSLTKVINERLAEYNKISNSDFKVALASKWVEKKETSYLLVFLLSFLFSFVMGFFLVYLYEYFRGYVSTEFEAEEILGKEALEVSTIRSWPTLYLRKISEKIGFEQIIGIGFYPLNTDKLALKSFNFPTELDKIDLKKKTLFVVKLGCSKEADLKQVAKLFELAKTEFTIIK